jgi:hypothetical protein
LGHSSTLGSGINAVNAYIADITAPLEAMQGLDD